MFPKVALFVGLSLIAGCSSSPSGGLSSGNTSLAPIQYKEKVVYLVRQTFIDPYSVRDAEISKPFYQDKIWDGDGLMPQSSWVVCVRANGKNKLGAYTGRQNILVLFNGQTPVKSLSGPDFQGQVDSHCSNATMEPFPEIENLQ